VSVISWKSRRSVFHALTMTPAKMDAVPHSSSMGPSLRRDDDALRRDDDALRRDHENLMTVIS
jgi:hypothetical protein